MLSDFLYCNSLTCLWSNHPYEEIFKTITKII
jgi:hypothetical protein